VFSQERKRLRGELVNMYKNLMGENEHEGARLFSAVPRDRARGNGHKLHVKFHLSTTKHFFTVRVVKH